MRIALVLTLLALVPVAAATLPTPVPVAAVGFSFASPALVVPAGTTVEWIGAALPHTVTSSADLSAAIAGVPDGALDADLPMGTRVSATFAESGQFSYFCRVHVRAGMVGTIVVT